MHWTSEEDKAVSYRLLRRRVAIDTATLDPSQLTDAFLREQVKHVIRGCDTEYKETVALAQWYGADGVAAARELLGY